ncbi:MAG: hypothetical protein FJZ00_03320 [Candidatus Sericytochromatia bacterium]|uniref:Uncharacterized protein n=1 Tax=Candidatus Tanganyikabacteria bacterium TaxID=2961651 RepID=A0A937X5U5_9BACT|nr:hypothetical protein [Candidatus Tanganyikabacteria bacterium]
MDAQKQALRAAEIALLAGVWLVGSGILIGLGPLAWSGGALKLGVHFPHAPIIMNVAGGAVAVLMCASRAWNHQPAGTAWVAALIGVMAAAVPVVTDAPAYLQQHNLLAGLALAAAAVASALSHAGAIGKASEPDWVIPGPVVSPQSTDANAGGSEVAASPR